MRTQFEPCPRMVLDKVLDRTRPHGVHSRDRTRFSRRHARISRLGAVLSATVGFVGPRWEKLGNQLQLSWYRFSITSRSGTRWCYQHRHAPNPQSTAKRRRPRRPG